MTPETILREFLELANQATSGHWIQEGNDVRVYYMHHNHRMALVFNPSNAKFIARSRSLAPRMAEALLVALEPNVIPCMCYAPNEGHQDRNPCFRCIAKKRIDSILAGGEGK